MSGWIKLHRSLLDWEWYDDLNVRVVFIHCLLKANCKDAKYKGKEILRGSFATGLELLSKETGLTIAQIRVTLNKLKMTNEIAIKTSSEGSIISVTNYDLYQSNDKQNDKQITNEITNEQQTNDKQIASNKNIKNDKKEKNEKKEERNGCLFEDGLSFETAWEKYGKKGNRKTSEKRWNSLSAEKKKLALEKIPLYVLSKPDLQFRKNFETWINQECWNDRIISNKCQADLEYKLPTNPDGTPLF